MTVGGHQVEERLAIGGDFLLETFLVLAVLLHRLDTIEASSLGLVALAGEDDLAVGGLQVELILAVLPASNFKFSHIELILKLVQAANIHFFGKWTTNFMNRNNKNLRPVGSANSAYSAWKKITSREAPRKPSPDAP